MRTIKNAQLHGMFVIKVMNMWNLLLKVTTLVTITTAVTAATTVKLRCFADVIFLLDSSGSIGSTDFGRQLDFVRGFVQDFDIGPQDVRVGVVTFSDNANNQFNLNTYSTKQEILAAIDRIPYVSGGTNTAGGLDYVRQSFTRGRGDRRDAANIVIVMTDGQSNNRAQTVAAAARFDGYTRIVAIGVGSNVDLSELQQIAGSNSFVYKSTSYSTLHALTQDLKEGTCKVIPRVEFRNDTSTGENKTGGVPMVNQGGVWAEICGDGVDVKDATVICRTLGYGNFLQQNRSAYLTQYTPFVQPDSINVITDRLECTGNEPRIILCPLKEQTGVNTCHQRVFVNCVPTLAEAITSRCTTTHWNISVDTDLLNITYPGSHYSYIYLGENSCVGMVRNGNQLVFNQDLHACGTSISYSQTNKIYTNQLVYAFHDPANPLIIRYYNWTMGVTCLHSRDQSAQTPLTYNQTHTTNTTFTSSTQYHLVTQFYSDQYFVSPMSGHPLQVPVGGDVYIKVMLDSDDWSIRMRINTCYVQGSRDAVSQKYYLIQNGCETDVSTHIISTAAHETKFVFKMIQLANGHNSVFVHCDAVFCDNSVQQCSHTCN